MAARNAGNDHVKDGDDAGDDGLEDCADAVDDGHETAADCAQDGLDLLYSIHVSISSSGVGQERKREMTYARDNSTHDDNFYLLLLRGKKVYSSSSSM